MEIRGSGRVDSLFAPPSPRLACLSPPSAPVPPPRCLRTVDCCVERAARRRALRRYRFVRINIRVWAGVRVGAVCSGGVAKNLMECSLGASCAALLSLRGRRPANCIGNCSPNGCGVAIGMSTKYFLVRNSHCVQGEEGRNL